MFFFDGFCFFLMTEIPFLVFGLVSAGAGDNLKKDTIFNLVLSIFLWTDMLQSPCVQICGYNCSVLGSSKYRAFSIYYCLQYSIHQHSTYVAIQDAS